MAAISEGNLATAMAGEYEGDFGQLADAVNMTREKLVEIIGSVRESARSSAPPRTRPATWPVRPAASPARAAR